jgi:hypothetical protein
MFFHFSFFVFKLFPDILSYQPLNPWRFKLKRVTKRWLSGYIRVTSGSHSFCHPIVNLPPLVCDKASALSIPERAKMFATKTSFFPS